MRVLITGAEGFLGTASTAALSAARFDVRAVTRRPGRVGAIECDLADPRAVCALLAAVEPEAIVNLAAAADFSPGVLPLLYPVNTLCPALMANWCAANSAYLVQASMAVHGREAARFDVQQPGAPQTDYGRSKWLAEEAIAASGCPSGVIRLGGIFGSRGPAHLGLNRAIAEAQSRKRPTIVGHGSARRNYIHVDDAAAGIVACVTGRLRGVFYAAGEIQTIRDMLQAVCDVWLPGEVPFEQTGPEAADQIVEASPELGPVRPFRAGLEACR
jgi:nucleoside-diphosphate-sugar epimerase